MPDSMIVATQLSRSYGDLPALATLDLTIDRGARVALVGHNGSGKSTLLKMLAAQLEPTTGSVSIAGAPADSAEARRARSYLADTPTFYEDLSVREHLEYVGRLHGAEQWSAEGERLLERLGIANRGDDLPQTFSRGLKQKAAIALAFVRPFEVLLVDEPFVGLDAAGRSALIELIDEAASAGSTVVVATHELPFADRMNRMIALRDGHIIHDGEASTDLAQQLVD